MNEAQKNMQDRFSCRDFEESLPTKEQLTAVAQSAIQAPSGMNRQFWHVFVIANKEIISEMQEEATKALYNMNKEFYDHIMADNGSLFHNAPVMILIATKKAEPAGGELVDLGIIAQNVVLSAESMGLNTLICGLTGLAFAGEAAKGFKERIGFPEGYEFGTSVLIGKAKTKRAPHEPDQTKITYVN